jgi:cytidyltransferase-like protein
VKKYGNDYKVAGIIDNDSSKWGGEKYGVKIYPPEYLRQLESGSYKIIICIKYYDAIIKQLEELEIKDYCVYDVEMTYARDLPVTVSSEGKDKNAPKKYHIGYIAGVFDLFHIGHLNLFRRAKEQCDYLIVGVVTDEGVIRNKKTAPYIPFKERIEIVRSCRYVDEAVEIPVEAPDTYDAYKRYKFDVQFSGSDYEDNPYWIAKKTFLQQHGSDMVFFPYTQSTSSTKLKGLIEKRLL